MFLFSRNTHWNVTGVRGHHVWEFTFKWFRETRVYIMSVCVWRVEREMTKHMVHCLGKAMATHSSTLAWKIPWTEKPGRLQSMWSQRVGHDWATSLSFLSLSLFNLYAEYIIQNAGLDKAQAGIKIAGRNINNLRYADDTTLIHYHVRNR